MDDDQQFCLRWNNHQSTLISVFDTLLENGTLVDCTLAAEGKFLKAHKVVLSACSPYFATLLSQQYDKHPIFILKDVKFQELRAMMDYMYRGEVNISQDQLAALLKAAESLQIKGLSDSRGGSSTQKPTNEHKTLSVPVAGKGGSSTGYTLEQKRPRHTLDTQELSGSREGSSSPTSRKRKKIRRRSVDNVMADNHEHSNSSSHSMQVNSSILPSSNTSAAIASISANAATSLSTSSTVAAISGTVGAVTGINVTKKTENMSNAKIGSIECENDDDDDDDNDDELDENDKQIGVVKKEQIKRKSHAESDPNKDGSDMLIEPKSEYDDGNDETVEDLTLDDEELLEDLDQAGPSHGGGEGSSQGYAQWQVDRSSQDEVFMAAQDAAGQQRDPQELASYWEEFHVDESGIITFGGDYKFDKDKREARKKAWRNSSTSNRVKKVSGYLCGECGKSYKHRGNLGRHIKYECGKPGIFACPVCDRRFHQGCNLQRHVATLHMNHRRRK